VYHPFQDYPDILYAKKVEVKEGEFLQAEFSLVLIPGIPTSAILKRAYDDFSDPCSKQAIVRGGCSLMAPVLWILVVSYGISMDAFSQTDFWVQWGLGLLFIASMISSICFAYLLVASQTKQWVHGGACRVERSRVPTSLLGDGVDSPTTTADDGDGCHGDGGPLAPPQKMQPLELV